MVSPDVKAGIRTVLAYYGPKIAHEMWASTVRSVELVREIGKRPDIDAVTHESGIAALGQGSRQLKRFDQTAEWFRNRFGVDWQVVDARNIATIVGGEYFNVALLRPEGFGVHPARLAFGLAAQVRHAGAILVDHCDVISMRRVTTGMEVKTSRGPVRAGDVILATNGYTTRNPSRELDRLVVSVGSYIIATEPVGDLAEVIFPGGTLTYTTKRLLTYQRRTHDDRIVLGGRVRLHPDLDPEESARDLRENLTTYWPDLAEVEITHVWGGRVGIPFDLIPHIGRIDGAWYAVGYAGHGVGLSCQLGHELAGMLLGEDPPSVFSQVRHDGRFYYTGGDAWFLTPAYHISRALDRINV